MKFPWTSLVMTVLLLLSVVASSAASLHEQMSSHPISHSEATIQQRLNNLDSPVSIQPDPAVMEHIKQYVVGGYKGTERILGRTALYFPIFEHYLKVYRLPEQLKCLSVIESRLQPEALSSAGALGLWQFTTATARQYGLTVNEQVDERKDPVKSTEAAVRYLATLYAKYKDWALVLAAYNCGPGRLNQAMAVSGAKDFWTVRQYLPSETQAYVPRFIAANYLLAHYHDHGLVPLYPSYDLQITNTIKVHERITLDAIAAKAGVAKAIVERLNPSYKRGYIPASKNGHYLILPSKAMASYTGASSTGLARQVAFNSTSANTHTVEAGATLETIAKRFKCSVKDIQYWNNLTHDQLFYGQAIVVKVQ